jgi:hypothetical protein
MTCRRSVKGLNCRISLGVFVSGILLEGRDLVVVGQLDHTIDEIWTSPVKCMLLYDTRLLHAFRDACKEELHFCTRH